MVIWSAVASGKVTLGELETVYSLDDLERLTAFLSFQADATEQATKGIEDGIQQRTR